MLKAVFKGAATTVITPARRTILLHADYERMLQSGIKPNAGQAHAGPSDRGDGAVDVEAPGGVRPEATPAGDRADVGRSVEARRSGSMRSDVAARERFEGEHPLVSWSPGRDGKTHDEGYAPSEYRLKQWPNEGPIRSMVPPFCGRNADTALTLERVAGPSAPRAPRVAESPSPISVARSGARRQGRLASTTIRPLQELARAPGENYSLDNSFLRS